MVGLRPGLSIYRNHDHAFLRQQVERYQPTPKIAVRLRLESTVEGFLLHAEDESGLDMHGRVVMHTRYCIQHQLGLCDGARHGSGPRPASKLGEPLYLVDPEGHHYRLRFNCADCEMEVVY